MNIKFIDERGENMIYADDFVTRSFTARRERYDDLPSESERLKRIELFLGNLINRLADKGIFSIEEVVSMVDVSPVPEYQILYEK